MSYSGCAGCRPERELRGKVKKGPAAGMLAGAALAFAALCAATNVSSGGQSSQPCEPGPVPAAGAGLSEAVDVKLHPVYHIIEEPGGIKHLTECE